MNDLLEGVMMINAMTHRNEAATALPPPSEIRALILDDNQFDRTKIRRMFRTTGLPFNLDEAESIEALAQFLDQDVFDIVLIDYNLPEGNGIEALKLVQRHAVNSTAATIIVTGDDQSQIAVQALKMGCQDYIPKAGLSVESLRLSVQNSIEQAEIGRRRDVVHAKDLQDLTLSIMSNYSKALQPEIAKMVRDIRQMKTSISEPDRNLPSSLEAIEHRCLHLWEVLANPLDARLDKDGNIGPSANVLSI